jgi:hypothetical protein
LAAQNRGHLASLAKDARKTALLRYLKQWESEVDIPFSRGQYAGTVSGQFQARKHEFAGLLATVESDYWNSAAKSVQLTALAQAITDMTPGKVDDEQGQKHLLAAIRAMIAFLGAN